MIRLNRHAAVAVLALAAAAAGLPGAAWSATPKPAASPAAKCAAGAQADAEGDAGKPRPPGSTPTAVAGAVTVSATEAKCLIDQLGERLLVLQVMRDDHQLPGAKPVPELGTADVGYDTEQRLAQRLAELTGADKQRPLLIYCHHEACPLSYNATLHAVKAGYRTVYWLRGGNTAWKRAGLPFKDDLPGPGGLPVRYEYEVKACAVEAWFELNDHYAMMLDNPTDAAALRKEFADEMVDVKRKRASCYNRLATRYGSNDRVAADLQARLARNEREVELHMARLRDEAEGNPAGMLAGFDGVDFTELRSQLDLARAYRSVPQRCGGAPGWLPTDNGQLAQVRQQLTALVGCVDGIEKEMAAEPRLDVKAFSDPLRVAQAIGRFTCSQRPHPRCVPDDKLRSMTALLTQDNLRTMQRAAELQASRKADLDKLMQESDAYVRRMQQHIADVNERRSSNDHGSGGGYAGPAYPQPPEVPLRRDSSTSARGMR